MNRRPVNRRLRGLRALALGALLGLAAGAASAADLPAPWVQLAPGGGLELRAITAPGAACPSGMQPRSAPVPAFPVQVCAGALPPGTRSVQVNGLSAPVLPPALHRIVVIGDTGCRLKGHYIQACNDPAAWPFARIALLASRQNPDLVIHVGDYYYRETACPADHPGCAGSPFGDNWASWKADFFDPAAPLLAAAPWVFTRGNHEDCARGGQGWFHLLAPGPLPASCIEISAPYALHLPGLDLLMLDSAAAEDDRAKPDKVRTYRAQLETLLAGSPPGAWLVTHRPVWAVAEGEGVPEGAQLNATEQAAIRDIVPPGLDMVLAGHVHDFASYGFGPVRPAQLVVGDGGDDADELVQPIRQGIVIDGVTVQDGFALSHYGYLVLDRSGEGWDGTVRGVDDAVLARCRLDGRAIACRRAQ